MRVRRADHIDRAGKVVDRIRRVRNFRFGLRIFLPLGIELQIRWACVRSIRSVGSASTILFCVPLDKGVSLAGEHVFLDQRAVVVPEILDDRIFRGARIVGMIRDRSRFLPGAVIRCHTQIDNTVLESAVLGIAHAHRFCKGNASFLQAGSAGDFLNPIAVRLDGIQVVALHPVVIAEPADKLIAGLDSRLHRNAGVVRQERIEGFKAARVRTERIVHERIVHAVVRKADVQRRAGLVQIRMRAVIVDKPVEVDLQAAVLIVGEEVQLDGVFLVNRMRQRRGHTKGQLVVVAHRRERKGLAGNIRFPPDVLHAFRVEIVPIVHGEVEVIQRVGDVHVVRLIHQLVVQVGFNLSQLVAALFPEDRAEVNTAVIICELKKMALLSDGNIDRRSVFAYCVPGERRFPTSSKSSDQPLILASSLHTFFSS